MTKVAIIYSLAGGGHISLAHSAIESLNRFAPGQFETILYNPFPQTFSYTHKTLANHFVDFYRLGMKATENSYAFPAIKGLSELTITRKITKFLKDQRPDIVIVNHPLAAAALPSAIEKSYICPTTVVHFCDPFTTHKTWFINKSADLYLSSTPEMTKLAKRYGIPETKISTIGWLTKNSYVSGPQDRLLSQNNLGLNPHKFTVFLGGAGVGSTKTQEICAHLAASPLLLSRAQIIVNTGLNSRLVSEIMQLVQKFPGFFLLVPYLPNISELLSASDLVIGKAGPNFIFEAIHTLRPLIITSHLPGHEDGNPKFVKRAGLGWIESKPTQIVKRLESCLKNPQTLSSKVANLQHIKSQHQDSSSRFADAIIGLVRSKTAK